jgi:hypothetical protein
MARHTPREARAAQPRASLRPKRLLRGARSTLKAFELKT